VATTGAKATSVEAVLDALRQHPDATAAELAELGGIGRSTATRTLANLETQGRVTRQRGKAEAGGRTAPDRWALVPDTPKDPDETQQPATEQPATEQPTAEQPAAEQTDTSMSASQDQGHAGQDTPPSSADIASAETEETTTDAAEPTSKDNSQRLRPGELRALVHAWLAERPGQEFTPTKIGKELGRSAGAVGNALATMTDAGEVTKTSAKPRKYMLAPQPGEAAETETAKAS
jgi:DNA-binding MarR family transcriptional regulator